MNFTLKFVSPKKSLIKKERTTRMLCLNGVKVKHSRLEVTKKKTQRTPKKFFIRIRIAFPMQRLWPAQ